MKAITLDEKIKFIEESASLEQVQKSGILPDPDSQNGYYFVSYSHKDYKIVFKYVLRLLEQGVNLWYDRGLEAGKSWREDVKRKIYSYNCKGVICFLSSNCFGSESLLKEYEMIRKFNKPTVAVEMNESIFDPVVKAFTLDDGEVDEKAFREWLRGISKESEYLPALPGGKVLDKEKQAVLLAIAKIKRHGVVFENSLIDDFITTLKSLPQPALFRYKFEDDPVTNEKIAVLTGINDVGIRTVDVPRFARKNKISVRQVQEGCFANCRYLEEVRFTDEWTDICDGAFYNCKRLAKVNLGLQSKKGGFIEERRLCVEAFDGCESLKELTVPGGVWVVGAAQYLEKITLESPASFNLENSRNVTEINAVDSAEISDNALTGCVKLKRFIIPENCKKIGESAFKGCTLLEGLRFPPKVKLIAKNACAGCSSLYDLKFECESYIIGAGAFRECVKLRYVEIKNARRIGNFAFNGCESLEEIKLVGDELTMYAGAFTQCHALKTVTIDLRRLICMKNIGGEPQKVEENVLNLFPFVQKLYLKKNVGGLCLEGFGKQISERAEYELWERL